MIAKFIWPLILRHPNIPKPMHGVNPRTILGQEWWDIQRNVAYKRNNYCCWACGVHKSRAKYHQWLEAHECYYIDYEQGRMELHLISALCHLCHNYIHSGRLNMMLDGGEITKEFYNDVIEHGDKLVTRMLKDKNKPIPESLEFLFKTIANAHSFHRMCAWEDWRLVIGDKEFPPLYKSYAEWRSAYSK